MALPQKAKITSIALLLAVATGCTLYLNRPESSASTQSTDDAYVQADFTTVASQVPGTVKSVLVQDNQMVRAGDLLAVIDDREFVVTVDAAKARVASAQASIASLQAHLVRQEAAIRQAQAAVAADDASLQLARENQVRHRNLSVDGSGTVLALQQAEAQVSIQSAGREKNLATDDPRRSMTCGPRTQLRESCATSSCTSMHYSAIFFMSRTDRVLSPMPCRRRASNLTITPRRRRAVIRPRLPVHDAVGPPVHMRPYLRDARALRGPFLSKCSVNACAAGDSEIPVLCTMTTSRSIAGFSSRFQPTLLSSASAVACAGTIATPNPAFTHPIRVPL